MINLFLNIPLWGIFFITFLVVLISFEIGVLLGKKHRQVSEKEDRSPIGSIVAATLGLLAFLLAFTFGIAAARFDDRRELVLDEANAIGTTYLRAGYLANPYKSEIRSMLKNYVSIRLDAITFQQLEQGAKKSEELQDQLWNQAVAVAEQNPNSIVVGLFISSLNEVIDLHTKRVNVGMRFRIPLIVWSALYFITLLAMSSLGYQLGLTQTRYTGITLLLIITFSSVISLIADLDRPQEGFIRVSQQPLIDLMDKFSKGK